MGVAEKIKILLLKRKKSQLELAEKLGISHQYLNNKLRQERFTREELEAIAAFLGAVYNEDPPPRQWFTLNDTGEEI
jgi:transcriptional regulator with XRE-family HTH domain